MNDRLRLRLPHQGKQRRRQNETKPVNAHRILPNFPARVGSKSYATANSNNLKSKKHPKADRSRVGVDIAGQGSLTRPCPIIFSDRNPG